jgi:hypothetical protein
MKPLVALVVLSFAVCAFAQSTPAPTLKIILLQGLRETHNEKDWFVSAKDAVAGLTPEQAAWTDGKGNHSVGQLMYHLAFWNAQSLAKFKGEPPEKFSGNNDDTFNNYDPKQWAATVKKFDEVMTELENVVKNADDAQLAKWAPTIMKIGEHNAYHIGEIVMVRKAQGSWNPENGVK